MKIVCRCEEVTEEEIVELVRKGYTSIEAIKRITRAGMGHCQGRTCLRLIAQIIARETGKKMEEMDFPCARPPVKPIPLKALK